MKVILYIAQSLDGFIARENGRTDFVGGEDLRKFKGRTIEAGNVIMGKGTYLALEREHDFPLPNRYNVVMSHLQPEDSEGADYLFTTQSPKEVLALLKDKAFEEACVIGGAKIAKSFLEQKLVDEIYVTIEPIILSKGTPLVQVMDESVELSLMETIEISSNEIQLHYEVKKTIYGI